jgi:hypothetical protein
MSCTNKDVAGSKLLAPFQRPNSVRSALEIDVAVLCFAALWTGAIVTVLYAGWWELLLTISLVGIRVYRLTEVLSDFSALRNVHRNKIPASSKVVRWEESKIASSLSGTIGPFCRVSYPGKTRFLATGCFQMRTTRERQERNHTI